MPQHPGTGCAARARISRSGPSGPPVRYPPRRPLPSPGRAQLRMGTRRGMSPSRGGSIATRRPRPRRPGAGRRDPAPTLGPSPRAARPSPRPRPRPQPAAAAPSPRSGRALRAEGRGLPCAAAARPHPSPPPAGQGPARTPAHRQALGVPPQLSALQHPAPRRGCGGAPARPPPAPRPGRPRPPGLARSPTLMASRHLGGLCSGRRARSCSPPRPTSPRSRGGSPRRRPAPLRTRRTHCRTLARGRGSLR
mmetsp:Transcript_45865/g.146385  ORF Transcript_45865/g.146385 Transcript_45865/m.146385 type:complete len:250 (-) Transcript_45865:286-1035(-)